MPRLAAFAPLTTPRLDLVALCFDHVPAVFAYASDPEISRQFDGMCHKRIEDSRRFVAQAMVAYEEGGCYEWGLVRRTDQAFLGTCGIGQLGVTHGVGEICYVLAKPHWGQGYATEAAAAVLQFGFVQLGLRVIQAQAFCENVASLRVMAKLGLQYHETRFFSISAQESRPVNVWQIERTSSILRGVTSLYASSQ